MKSEQLCKVFYQMFFCSPIKNGLSFSPLLRELFLKHILICKGVGQIPKELKEHLLCVIHNIEKGNIFLSFRYWTKEDIYYKKTMNIKGLILFFYFLLSISKWNISPCGRDHIVSSSSCSWCSLLYNTCQSV